MDNDQQFTDRLQCKNNPDILAHLDTKGGEHVVYSCVVVKINRFGMKQERTLLLTNKALYNLKKNEQQRSIHIKNVRFLTQSTKDGNKEFVVHVKNEYDYRFESDYRQEIFDAIKYVYWKHFGTNILVYGVPEGLKNHHTTKRDIESNNEYKPEQKYLLKQAKLYPEQARGDSVASNAVNINNSFASDGNFDEIVAANKEFAAQRGMTMYTRNIEEAKADLNDFQIKSVIGKGSFGKVFLVEKKDTKKVYAMKSLRKDVILDYDQIESTMLEKDILQKANHPFLVGMDFVFQTDHKIFFVMRFVRGGELFTHLRKARQFSEKRAKFYALTVALALGHLHKQKIIYRDLKPENILMDEDGYICLTDFGLAKILEGNEMAQSFCGTPEYLAPEILNEVGHAFPVDWWALGILTYEMIVGFPPFYTGSSNNNKMYELIKTKAVFFPDAAKHGIQMSDKCKDFINKCLSKDPKERLGYKNDVDEVIGHPWFADLDVNALINKQIEVEFKPKLSKNVLDVSNFEKMFTSEEAVHSVLPVNVTRKIDKNKDKFEGFNK